MMGLNLHEQGENGPMNGQNGCFAGLKRRFDRNIALQKLKIEENKLQGEPRRGESCNLWPSIEASSRANPAF